MHTARLTARVQVVDEIDVEIGELVCKIIFDGVGNRTEEQRQLGSMEYCSLVSFEKDSELHQLQLTSNRIVS